MAEEAAGADAPGGAAAQPRITMSIDSPPPPPPTPLELRTDLPHQQPAPELRIDPENGCAYDKESFLDFYGPEEGGRRWAAAVPTLTYQPSPAQPTDQRVDVDKAVQLLMPSPPKKSKENMKKFLQIKGRDRDGTEVVIGHHRSYYHKLFEERFYV